MGVPRCRTSGLSRVAATWIVERRRRHVTTATSRDACEVSARSFREHRSLRLFAAAVMFSLPPSDRADGGQNLFRPVYQCSPMAVITPGTLRWNSGSCIPSPVRRGDHRVRGPSTTRSTCTTPATTRRGASTACRHGSPWRRSVTQSPPGCRRSICPPESTCPRPGGSGSSSHARGLHGVDRSSQPVGLRWLPSGDETS